MILRLKTQRVHCSYRKAKFFRCFYWYFLFRLRFFLSFFVIIIITGEPILFDSDKNDIVIFFVPLIYLFLAVVHLIHVSLLKKQALNNFSIKSHSGFDCAFTLDQVRWFWWRFSLTSRQITKEVTTGCRKKKQDAKLACNGVSSLSKMR